jgi:hypothetical protein
VVGYSNQFFGLIGGCPTKSEQIKQVLFFSKDGAAYFAIRVSYTSSADFLVCYGSVLLTETPVYKQL